MSSLLSSLFSSHLISSLLFSSFIFSRILVLSRLLLSLSRSLSVPVCPCGEQGVIASSACRPTRGRLERTHGEQGVIASSRICPRMVFMCSRGSPKHWILPTLKIENRSRTTVSDSSNHSLYKLFNSSYPDGHCGSSITLSPLSFPPPPPRAPQQHTDTHRDRQRETERQGKKTKPKYNERFVRPSTMVSCFLLHC